MTRDPLGVLRLAMRIAVRMLANGSQTEDVEASIGQVVHAYGVGGVQAAVSFSMISISHSERHDEQPTTLLHLVRGRTIDFSRMAAMSDLVRRIGSGEVDPEAADAEIDRLDAAPPPYSALIAFAAPGLSAAGATLMFGGNLLEALATLAIGLAVQPGLIALDRTTLPPFFRLATGTAVSAILVALLVGLGLEITAGLVLAGSLLRFLPGYALVSGFRDLIDGSVVSGTARLAEALLLGAAVAGGTALSVAVASWAGVDMRILTVGDEAWGLPISVAASLLAVGAFAIQLGVPPRFVAEAAVIGAIGWLLPRATSTWADGLPGSAGRRRRGFCGDHHHRRPGATARVATQRTIRAVGSARDLAAPAGPAACPGHARRNGCRTNQWIDRRHRHGIHHRYGRRIG